MHSEKKKCRVVQIFMYDSSPPAINPTRPLHLTSEPTLILHEARPEEPVNVLGEEVYSDSHHPYHQRAAPGIHGIHHEDPQVVSQAVERDGLHCQPERRGTRFSKIAPGVGLTQNARNMYRYQAV